MFSPAEYATATAHDAVRLIDSISRAHARDLRGIIARLTEAFDQYPDEAKTERFVIATLIDHARAEYTRAGLRPPTPTPAECCQACATPLTYETALDGRPTYCRFCDREV